MAPKRTRRRSFGYIRETSPGRFSVQFYDRTVTPPKRYTAGRSFRTRSEAQSFLARTEAEMNSGTWLAPDERQRQQEREEVDKRREDMTLAVWAEHYLSLKKRECKAPTHRTIVTRVNKHIVPVLGHKRLVDITAEDVNEWYDGLTVNKVPPYQTFRNMMNEACESDLTAITTHPVHIKGAGKSHNVETRYLPTDDEVRRLMECAPDNLKALLCIGYDGGLRVNEALALRRENISLDERRGLVKISVKGSLTRRPKGEVGTGQIVGDTKSKAGRRTVYLQPDSSQYVLRHLKLYVDSSPEALLFPSKSDPKTPWRDDRFTEEFKAWAKRAGIHPPTGQSFTFHALRHYSATRFGRGGGTLAALKNRYGWSDNEVAMRYQHADDDMQAEYVGRMEKLTASADASNVVDMTKRRNKRSSVS